MQGWRAQAACKDTNPALFFPSENSTRQTKAAKAICRGCFCRVDCLNFAIETDSVGIFGGTTYDERTIIAGIFASSDAPSGKTSLELELRIHTVSCTYSPKPEQLPVASTRPLVLILPKLSGLHSPVPVGKVSGQVAAGFSVRPLKLRFS